MIKAKEKLLQLQVCFISHDNFPVYLGSEGGSVDQSFLRCPTWLAFSFCFVDWDYCVISVRFSHAHWSPRTMTVHTYKGEHKTQGKQHLVTSAVEQDYLQKVNLVRGLVMTWY